MNAFFVAPSASANAVKLLIVDPQHLERLAGRLEHVLSGRRYDFANGQGLLACLAFEQQQAVLDATATRSTAPPKPMPG